MKPHWSSAIRGGVGVAEQQVDEKEREIKEKRGWEGEEKRGGQKLRETKRWGEEGGVKIKLIFFCAPAWCITFCPFYS